MTEKKSDGERIQKSNRGKYDRAIADLILEELAKGRTLTSIIERDDVPIGYATIYNWKAANTDGFRDRYEEARKIFWEVQAETMLDIADDASNDWMETRKGTVLDKEAVMRSRLRFEARQWLLAKALPKMYGDKSQLELSGPGGGPVRYENTGEFREKFLEQLGRMAQKNGITGANQNDEKPQRLPTNGRGKVNGNGSAGQH